MRGKADWILGVAVAGVLALPAGPAWATAPSAPAFAAPARGKILVAIVLSDQANLIDFAGPWEVFSSVDVPERAGAGAGGGMDMDGDRYPFQLFTVAETRAPIAVEGALTVTPTYTFDDAPTPRIVVVGAQAGSPKLKAWLQKVAADPQTDVTMSVCTGAFKLAGAGLLDGKPATTHHGFYDAFAKRFPQVELQRGARFVQSGPHLFTAGGLTSGIDLALHIVELYFGRDAAQRAADWLEYRGTEWQETASQRPAPGR